jgi:hypothetical protein
MNILQHGPMCRPEHDISPLTPSPYRDTPLFYSHIVFAFIFAPFEFSSSF